MKDAYGLWMEDNLFGHQIIPGKHLTGQTWLPKARVLTSPVELLKTHVPRYYCVRPSFTKIRIPWWRERYRGRLEWFENVSTDNSDTQPWLKTAAGGQISVHQYRPRNTLRSHSVFPSGTNGTFSRCNGMCTAAWLKEHVNHLIYATIEDVSTPALQRQGRRNTTRKGSVCHGTTKTLKGLSRADPEPCSLLAA